ncbi:hypothetical protein PS2_011462 [Malus domestica]
MLSNPHHQMDDDDDEIEEKLLSSLEPPPDDMCYELSLSFMVPQQQSCGSDRVTALHCATAGGSTASLEVVKLLLGASADANCVNAYGNRPVDLIALALNSPCSSRRKAMEMLFRGDRSVMESDQIAIEKGDQLKVSSPQMPKEGSDKKEYPIDISLPDTNNGDIWRKRKEERPKKVPIQLCSLPRIPQRIVPEGRCLRVCSWCL